MSAGLDRASPVLPFVDVYSDAWRVYRLLFRRSVLTAAIVFGVVRLLRPPGRGRDLGPLLLRLELPDRAVRGACAERRLLPADRSGAAGDPRGRQAMAIGLGRCVRSVSARSGTTTSASCKR